jgi:hypothetical protein
VDIIQDHKNNSESLEIKKSSYNNKLNDTLSDIKDKKYKTDTVLKTPTLDNVK